MIAVPVVGAIVALLWIARVNVLEEPFSKLLIVAGAVVALTALLGILEAFLSGSGSDENASGPAAYGPVLWIPLLTLGWIVGFPLYLKHAPRAD